MEDKNTKSAKMSISSHLSHYTALYLAGGLGGFSMGWFIAFIMTGLNIVHSPWNIPIVLGLFILGAYFPRLNFAKKVPAICPSCGGDAFLKWPSKPIIYVCSSCNHTEKTRISLGR